MAEREDSVEPLIAAGARAWPMLRLDADVFRAHLLSILARPDSVGIGSLPIGDLFLACCCAHSPAAIAVFQRKYAGEIESAARTVDQSPAFIDEVRQRLDVSLFVGERDRTPKILQYIGRGPLGSWTRIATQRVAQRLRKQAGNARDSSDEELLEGVTRDADPLISYLKASYKDELRHAIVHAFSALPAGDRMLLRLHFVDQLTMDRIAAIYRVHQTTISRRLKAIRDQVLVQAKAILRGKLDLSASECDSLVRLVQSQVDLSLSRLFDEHG